MIYSGSFCSLEKLEFKIPSIWKDSQFYAYTFIVNTKEVVSNSQLIENSFSFVIWIFLSTGY